MTTKKTANETKITKRDEEWQRELTPQQYAVCRQRGTEIAFSGMYYHCDDKGTFVCVCCKQPLFSSETKYDSGSGWPSFWQPIDDNAILRNMDQSHGMTRVEVVCSRCDAHLGHVFPDGPRPTGERYCINSVSLELIADSSRND